MRVLIGIPTHRRPELLRKCLESVEGLTGFTNDQIEVFVADNDRERHEGADLVCGLSGYRFKISADIVAEPGISAVRNRILKEASRPEIDFLAFIDDDMTVSPSWLSAMMTQRADIVGGTVVYELPEGTPGYVEAAFRPHPHQSGPIDCINGTNGVLISQGILYKTNYPIFDPAYGLTGGGDKEWFTRMKRFGARFAFCAEAVAFEYVPPERATAGWYLKRRFRIGADDVRIFGKGQLFGAVGTILSLPLQLALRPSLHTLGKGSRALGRWFAAFGVLTKEYAARH